MLHLSSCLTLANAPRKSFCRLSEDDQSLVLVRLGQLACARDQRPNISKSSKHNDKILSMQCPLCRYPDCLSDQASSNRAGGSVDLLPTLGNLLKLHEIQKNRRLGTMAMLCLKNLLSHTREDKSLDVVNSVYGQWCLRALQNPARDMRIAAG